MVPLSPQSLIIAARTLALLGAQDDYTFGDAPPRSLPARASEHGSPERWDLRFVHRCGYASHYDSLHGTSAPMFQAPPAETMGSSRCAAALVESSPIAAMPTHQPRGRAQGCRI